jgi:integrase
MAGLTGLFRRGSTYYMRVVLPLDHPLRSERPTGRIVISLGSSNYREALSKGYAKRAEILTGVSYETVPTGSSLAPRIHNLVSPTLTLQELHLRWQAANHTSDDSSRSCLRAIHLFEEFSGKVKLAQINRDMGDKFRSWLQQQPTSSKTARDRLVWVKSLLNYACQDLELLPKNPWRGLDIKAHTEAPRQPWSDESLTKLFSHPIWKEGLIPNETKAGGSAAYWIPIMALYSGARCSELCQLRTDDIKKESGVWMMQIHDGDPTQRIKTNAARRSIPLHDEILRLGFVQYCESITQGSLWPNLPKREGKAGGYFSQFFGGLRAELGIPPSMSFHSFRHSTRTNLVCAGVAESVVDKLLGHISTGGVGSKVYTHLSQHTLQAAINKLPSVTRCFSPQLYQTHISKPPLKNPSP